MKRLLVFCGLVMMGAVMASVATAQEAGELGYGGGGGNVQEELGGGNAAGGAGEVGVSGGLPFTGLDLGLLVAAGIALLATGLIVRRYGRSRA